MLNESKKEVSILVWDKTSWAGELKGNLSSESNWSPSMKKLVDAHDFKLWFIGQLQSSARSTTFKQ